MCVGFSLSHFLVLIAVFWMLAWSSRLNAKDGSAGSIEIRLRVDTSALPAVDEYGLGYASQVLENGVGRLEKQTGGNRVLDRASGVVDQVDGYANLAEAGYSHAQNASDSLGFLHDALLHLDKVVHLVDGFASVSAEARLLHKPVTSHSMTGSSSVSISVDGLVFRLQGMARLTLSFPCLILSSPPQALKQQLEQDAVIQNLALQLRDILAYAKECHDLKAVKGGTNTIHRMGQLVVQGGSLIDDCMRYGFLCECFCCGLVIERRDR